MQREPLRQPPQRIAGVWINRHLVIRRQQLGANVAVEVDAQLGRCKLQCARAQFVPGRIALHQSVLKAIALAGLKPQLRQRGAGMPVLQGRGRGDLVVEIAVETPTKLSKEQRALLEEFRELETGDECPESRGFFDKLKDAFGG